MFAGRGAEGSHGRGGCTMTATACKEPTSQVKPGMQPSATDDLLVYLQHVPLSIEDLLIRGSVSYI